MAPLGAWTNFYTIVGTSAGALIGLTFVVLSLVADRPVRHGISSRGIAAYNTPTVVHFGAALLASALLSAPWPSLAPAAVLLGVGGLGGTAYVTLVARRLWLAEFYSPVNEDWAFNAVLPLAAYVALVVAALLLPGSPTPALFVAGAALLVLLVAGIHNAWDVVTYMTVVGPAARQDDGEQRDPEPGGPEQGEEAEV